MTGPSTPATDYGALRRLYAWYAADYDRRFARYSARTLDRVEATLAGAAARDGRPQGPGCVIDVACGTGLLAERLRRRWPRTSIIGVDLSPDMLEVAARRLPASDGRDGRPLTAWRLAPAEALPVPDEAADTLVCTNAFHLVQQPEAALREFHRALALGGRLVLLDWSRDFASMALLLIALRVVRRQRRRPWTLDELRTAVADAGFRIESAERFRVGPVWGLMEIVARRIVTS